MLNRDIYQTIAKGCFVLLSHLQTSTLHPHHPVLTLLPFQTSHRPLPIHPSLHFLTHYVSLENFLLCSICPFPTSPTPFQQTHPLNGCSPYRRAGPGVLSVRCAATAPPRLNSRGRFGPPHSSDNIQRYLPFYKHL